MNIYTYVVDHGVDSPRVGMQIEINGGKLLVVAFDDYAKKLEEAEEFLDKLAEETSCDQTRYSIEDFRN